MLANWVMQKVTDGGSGDISLGDPFDGFIGVESVFDNNEELFYTVEDGTNRETGVATYVSSGKQLVRNQILEVLKDGVFSDSAPTALSLTADAKISITPSTQGLTTHLKMWKELPLEIIIPPASSVLTPDYKQFVANVDSFHFSPDLSEVLGLRGSYNNDVAEGSTMYPTLHWSPTDNTTGVVRWAITLSIAEINGTFSDAGVFYLEQAGSGTSSRHQLIELDTANTLVPSPNALVVGKVFRDSTHVNDTYEGEAVLHSVGFNYQSDRVGTPSRNIDHNNWS